MEKSKIITGKVHDRRLYIKKEDCDNHNIKNGSVVTVKLIEVLEGDGT